MGYGTSEDLVGDKITGFTIAQTISNRGVRVSSSASYLKPNRNKPNLHVALNALVSRILFENNKAVGVQFIMVCDSKCHSLNYFFSASKFN